MNWTYDPQWNRWRHSDGTLHLTPPSGAEIAFGDMKHLPRFSSVLTVWGDNQYEYTLYPNNIPSTDWEAWKRRVAEGQGELKRVTVTQVRPDTPPTPIYGPETEEESHHWECEDCGADHQGTDEPAVTDRGEEVCDTCVEVCEDCRATMMQSSTYTAVDSGYPYCINCVRSCSACEEFYSWTNDYGYCESCAERQGIEGLEHYHHTTPSMWLGGPVPKDDNGKHLGYYLGFELEVSAEYGQSAEPVKDWAYRHLGAEALVCKEDSSVEGYEIVSQPMTPEFFEAQDWESLFTVINNEHPIYDDEPEEHGLHVHIGRVAFDRDDIAIAAFAYLLSQDDHLERIARREPTSYCRKVDKPVSAAVVSRSKWTQQYDRLRREGIYAGRDAINFQNSSTIEIRAFRSTRNANDLRDAVRVVYLAAEYVRSLRVNREPIGAKSLHWEAFSRWVAANAPEAFPSIAGIKTKQQSNRRAA